MKEVTKKRKVKIGGVGMPKSLVLQEFGELIWNAFGEIPYHVGSSLTQKTKWRDVDVRLILSDEEYEKQGYGDPNYPHANKKWRAMTLVFSIFGQQMTGLPIDFQIQQQTIANEKEKGRRSALFNHSNITSNH